jgi:hypothetical protein
MPARKRSKPSRLLGAMKGRLNVASDFDAPLALVTAEKVTATQLKQPIAGATGTIRLTKLDAAVHQLNAGIRLYLAGDAISALTLAGAAEEALGALCQARGQKNALQFLHLWAKENLDPDAAWKVFVAGMNEVRNALKHAHHGRENEFEFHSMLTVQMIMRAVPMCSFLGVPESQEMKDFREHQHEEWPTAEAAANAHNI